MRPILTSQAIITLEVCSRTPSSATLHPTSTSPGTPKITQARQHPNAAFSGSAPSAINASSGTRSYSDINARLVITTPRGQCGRRGGTKRPPSKSTTAASASPPSSPPWEDYNTCGGAHRTLGPSPCGIYTSLHGRSTHTSATRMRCRCIYKV